MTPMKTAPSTRNWKSAPVTLSPEMRRVRDLALAEQKPQHSMSTTVGYVNHLGVKG